MELHKAMIEAIKATDTFELLQEVDCNLEVLSGLSNALSRNFDEQEPDINELQCNYREMQTLTFCINDYLLESKNMFKEVEKRICEALRSPG